MKNVIIQAAKAAVAACYPVLARSADYSTVINDRHFARLSGYLEEAREKGASVMPLSDIAADPGTRCFPPVLVRGVRDEPSAVEAG